MLRELDRHSHEFREAVNEQLEYNPETGVIRKRKGHRLQGVRFSKGKKIKARITLKDKTKHQPDKIAWLMHTGVYPNVKFMGYKNGDDTDWRAENLFLIGDDCSEANAIWNKCKFGENYAMREPAKIAEMIDKSMYSDLVSVLEFALRLLKKRIREDSLCRQESKRSAESQEVEKPDSP